jgi:hypothetical protein
VNLVKVGFMKKKRGKKWKNVKMGVMGRPEEAMGGGAEAVAVFGGWLEVKRWWFGVVVRVMMREKKKKEGAVWCRAGIRERKEKDDLKRGHVRDLNACNRSYSCALDHICAKFVCVMWASALEQTQMNLNVGPYLRSNVQGTIDRIVQSELLLFFFYKNIYTKKNIYKHKHKKVPDFYPTPKLKMSHCPKCDWIYKTKGTGQFRHSIK